MESILTSIKKMLGIAEEYKQFDADIIMHINSVFMTLTQLGVGPSEGFYIENETVEWTDFIPEPSKLQAVKSYMFMRVKLLFDPGSIGASTLAAYERMIQEYEWRLNLDAENPNTNTNPDPNPVINDKSARLASVTLLAANWKTETENFHYQIVTIEGTTQYSKVDLLLSAEQLNIFHNKDISFVTENEDGIIKVFAIGDKPILDYTMQVSITEVVV